MDFYLNTDNQFERLKKEYEKYGKLIVAVDFDNTIFDYHGEGHTYNYMIELLKRLKKLGNYIVISCCREESDYNFIKKYCDEIGIEIDGINENASFVPFRTSKLYYNVLLDDRAGLRETYNLLNRLCSWIEQEGEN